MSHDIQGFLLMFLLHPWYRYNSNELHNKIIEHMILAHSPMSHTTLIKYNS